jgi:hypothetical protein
MRSNPVIAHHSCDGRGPRWRRLVGCTTACVLGCALALTGVSSSTAAADPLSEANAQAVHLQAQVAALETKAEQASEKYNAAEAALANLVGEQRAANS